jgi:hypothetical protein
MRGIPPLKTKGVTMKKNKKYTHRDTVEKLDDYTVQLIEWVEKMEQNDLTRREVTTLVTKHGTVLVQVR